MRTKNTIKNLFASFGNQFVNQVLAFAYRTVFIHYLGAQYLGIQGLFTNILSVLSLGELGVGVAITYSLYKPLANNDTYLISALMNLFRRIYIRIGVAILLLGLMLVPFLPIIARGADNVENIVFVYLLYLLNSSLTYFMSYKRTLIVADQKQYKIMPIATSVYVVTIISKVLILITTQSFTLTLIAQLLLSFIENVIINRLIDRKYNLRVDRESRIAPNEMLKVTKNIKAMIFHKVGDVSINGTDNLIISSFINVTVVGLYSNYLMIYNLAFTVMRQIFDSSTASIGNLIATTDLKKSESIFCTINLVSFILALFMSPMFFFLVPRLIVLWIGDEYLLSHTASLLISVNLYLVAMRVPLGIFKNAGGIYSQDKYSPLVQSFFNLLISLVLVRYLGVEGVLIGTLVSSLLVPQWFRPYVVYKYLFKMSTLKYWKISGYYTIILVSSFVLISLLLNLKSEYFLTTGFFEVFIELLIIILVILLLLAVFIVNTKEFKAFISFFKRKNHGKQTC